MKRLITKKQSEIHIDDLNEDQIVIAIQRGKTIGFIYHEKSGWCYMQKDGFGEQWNCFSNIIESEFIDCEFYVLE